MGIFGWSYPPGCTSVPGDEPEPPCAICGKQVDSKTDPCNCPPCTHKDEDGDECGECGCIKHIPLKDLFGTLERLNFQLGEYNREYKRRQEELAYTCPCGERIIPNLGGEDYDYCQKCRKEVFRDTKGIGRYSEEL